MSGKMVKCIECGRMFEQKTRNRQICSMECDVARKRWQSREWYYKNAEDVLKRRKTRYVKKERQQAQVMLGHYVPPEERQKDFDHLDKTILKCGGAKAYEEKRRADALARLTPIVIPKELLEKHGGENGWKAFADAMECTRDHCERGSDEYCSKWEKR